MSKKRARGSRPGDDRTAAAPPRSAVATQPGPGRAGRNLPAATAVGVSLAALVLVSVYLIEVLFVGLACAAIVLAIWELANALAVRDIRPPLAPLAVGAVGMLVSAYAGGTEALVAAFALTVLAVLLWRLSDGPEAYLRDTTAGVFTAVYIPFLASFAVLMLAPDEDGARRVTLFILVTVCSDLGGYLIGMLIGRHPMAPRISPKKSWEGFAGSVIACAAGGSLAVPYLFDEPWWKGLVIGLAAVCSATLGDLGESLIKRDLGIKDMSTLLPGHGGIMDRLDSLLITAPVVWLLLTVLIPPVL
ncbi:MAG: phosphatidate cytidylyltransferase [Sporichthyaceae bacterium]|nr:phosphatidate cytidylyltransferase [Sporichthyaceae bacterium]